MALAARRTAGQTPCPVFTVPKDLATDQFPAKTKLTAWSQRYAFLRDTVSTSATDDVLRKFILEHPDDTIEAHEAVAAEIQRDVSEDVAPASASDSVEATAYLELGKLLPDSFNKHAMDANRGKEEFDGSVMSMNQDIIDADKASNGRFFKKNYMLAPDSYPINERDRNGNVHKKALPVGSNDIPDRFPIWVGKRLTYGSRITAIADGTTYGKTLKHCEMHLDRCIKALNSTDVEAPSESENNQVQALLLKFDARLSDFDFENLDKVGSTFERVKARRRNMATKFGNAWKLERQKVFMNQAKKRLKDDEQGDFAWAWRTQDKAIRTTSTRPLKLAYQYMEEGAETETISDLGKNPIGLSTFVRYDVRSALANHVDGKDFIAELRETIKRQQPETERKVNVFNPGLNDVTVMMQQVTAWLEDPLNQQAFDEWMEKDASYRLSVARHYREINGRYTLIRAQIPKDLEAAKAAKAQAKADEDAAFGAEGRERDAA